MYRLRTKSANGCKFLCIKIRYCIYNLLFVRSLLYLNLYKSPRHYANMGDVKEEVIRNFLNLQDVLSKVAVKLDNLSTNIEKLLNLFAQTAKSFQETLPEHHQDHELLETMKTMLEQNKIIAKSLSIIEERTRQPQSQSQPQYPSSSSQQNYTTYSQPRLPSSIKPSNPNQKMTPSRTITQQITPNANANSEQKEIKPKPLPQNG